MRINPVNTYSTFGNANNAKLNNTRNNYYPTPKTACSFEGDTVSFSQLDTKEKKENKLTKTLRNLFTPFQEPDVSYYDTFYKY